MSPRTRFLSLLAGVLLAAGACGEPSQALPTSPPYVPSPSAADTVPPPIAVLTTEPIALPPAVLPTIYPTNPTNPANPPNLPDPAGPPWPPPAVPTTRAPTRSPTPTPAHAAKCAAAPTGPDILALIHGQKGIPTAPLRVETGPFCAGIWSFTTVQLSGEQDDQLDPLMVVATGSGATIGLVAAGSDVCTNRVQTEAPAGIRVLACGF